MEPFDFVNNMPSDEEMDERVRWYRDNADIVMKGDNPKMCFSIASQIIKSAKLEHKKYRPIYVQKVIKTNPVAKQYYKYLTDAVLHDVSGSRLSYDNMSHKAYDFIDYTYFDYPRINA